MFSFTDDSKVTLGREFLKRMGTLAGILTQAMPMPRRKRPAIDQDWVAMGEDSDWVHLAEDLDWMTVAEDGELVDLTEGTDWVDLARKFLKLSAAVVPFYTPFPEDLSVRRSKLLEMLKAGDEVFPICADPQLAQALPHLGDMDTQSMVDQWAQLRTKADEIVAASAPKSTSTFISETHHKLNDARLSLDALVSSKGLSLSFDEWTTLRWASQACDKEVNSLKGYVPSEQQKMMVTEEELEARGKGSTNAQDREMAVSENPSSLKDTMSRLGEAQGSFLTLRRGINRKFTAQEWSDLKAQTYASCQLSVTLHEKMSRY